MIDGFVSPALAFVRLPIPTLRFTGAVGGSFAEELGSATAAGVIEAAGAALRVDLSFFEIALLVGAAIGIASLAEDPAVGPAAEQGVLVGNGWALRLFRIRRLWLGRLRGGIPRLAAAGFTLAHG